MLLFYSFLLALAALAASPVLLLMSLREPALRRGLRERLGGVPVLPANRPDPVWIQAVSVGEVRVAAALVAEFRGRRPDSAFVVSTTTPAGRKLAEASLGSLVPVFHFPLDVPPVVGRSLARLRPRAVVLVETEIWPNLIRACARRGIPVIVTNGRISDRSFPRYSLLRPLLRKVVGTVSLFCMQSEGDAARIRLLGADPDRIRVTGNVKWDLAGPGPSPEAIRKELGIADGSPVLVAGSTSPGEEEVVLSAWQDLRRTHPELRLVLAPRHPNRFEPVADLLARRNVLFSRRKEGADLATAPVLLLDTLGELQRLYAAGTVCFVGGSLAARGGQNLMEPAACGRPVLFGPRTENFAEAARSLLETGAGFRVRDPVSLASETRRLLSDPAAAQEAGRRGRDLVERNRGATRRTADAIAQLVLRPEA